MDTLRATHLIRYKVIILFDTIHPSFGIQKNNGKHLSIKEMNRRSNILSAIIKQFWRMREQNNQTVCCFSIYQKKNCAINFRVDRIIGKWNGTISCNIWWQQYINAHRFFDHFRCKKVASSSVTLCNGTLAVRLWFFAIVYTYISLIGWRNFVKKKSSRRFLYLHVWFSIPIAKSINYFIFRTFSLHGKCSNSFGCNAR